MKIIKLAVEKNRATAILALAACVLGFYGLARLPVDFLPELTYPMIKIHIWQRGATPEELDKNIADPIERQMASVEGLDYLESSSIEGMYTLLVHFQYGMDVDVAYQDVLAAMARAARQLPEDMEPPIVIKADPNQLPVLQITVSSDDWNLVQLREWSENWLQDQMLAVPGVAGSEIVGGLQREIRVHLDPVALERYQLSIEEVIKRLQEENIEQFAGRATVGEREFIARTVGEYQSLEEIRDVVLVRQPDTGLAVVTVRDIAQVEDAHEEVRVISRLDGNPCVKLSVMKQADANTVEVAQAVARRIEELEPLFPAGLQLGLMENQATYVEAALDDVKSAALQAALLVILVVLLFLGSWRQVMVMIIVLPITLVVVFAIMALAGFSLNLFSLAGLVVGMGVILDNSTVVLENITRRLRFRSRDTDINEEIVSATAELGPAILAATVSFVVLFFPFLLLPSLMTLLFNELIWVMAGIVVVSLLVAITLTPMLSSVLLGPRSRVGVVEGFLERATDVMSSAYSTVLRLVIRGRWILLAVFCIVFGLAAILLPRLPSEFIPRLDDGRVMIKVRMPTGAALGRIDNLLMRLEDELEGDPLIESYYTMAGGRVWGLYTFEVANEGEINIQLVPRQKSASGSGRAISTGRYVQQLRQRLAPIAEPGANVMISQMRVRGIRRMGDADVEVKISGQELETLFNEAQTISGILGAQEGVTNVHVSMDMTKPEYQLVVDRTRASLYGVTVGDVARNLRWLMTGAVATRYREGPEYYGVRLVVPEYYHQSSGTIAELPLMGVDGQMLRVKDVASIEAAAGPVEIVRENQIKQVIIRADSAGDSAGALVARVGEALSAYEVPPGYELSLGGQALTLADMQRSMKGVMLFALFFAFVVLAVQFNSFKLPVLVLLMVPFSLAGMVYALWLSSIPFAATVLVGMLVVVAATINDGVLLFTLANDLMRGERALGARSAVIEAARLRLRPRLMTTLTVIAGFVPLAFSVGHGGDLLQPMAVAAIGGLVVELFVALFLMPCLYVLVNGRRWRKHEQQVIS